MVSERKGGQWGCGCEVCVGCSWQCSASEVVLLRFRCIETSNSSRWLKSTQQGAHSTHPFIRGYGPLWVLMNAVLGTIMSSAGCPRLIRSACSPTASPLTRHRTRRRLSGSGRRSAQGWHVTSRYGAQCWAVHHVRAQHSTVVAEFRAAAGSASTAWGCARTPAVF